MCDKIIDTNIPLPKALIKFGKYKHMKKYLDYGEMRFSPAKCFSEKKEGLDKVADNNEASLYYPVENVVCAPIIDYDNGRPIYGEVKNLADKADLRLTNKTIQKIPIYSLYCYDNEPINAIVGLENYNQIVNDFPEYDSAVIIYDVVEFIKRIKLKFEIYLNKVIYTDTTPSECEIDNLIYMLFYKRKKYENQKEFRIALSQLRLDEAKNYYIGSISDIAYCVPLKVLKQGIVIAENDDVLQKLKTYCNENGYKIGEAKQFL